MLTALTGATAARAGRPAATALVLAGVPVVAALATVLATVPVLLAQGEVPEVDRACVEHDLAPRSLVGAEPAPDGEDDGG